MPFSTSFAGSWPAVTMLPVLGLDNSELVAVFMLSPGTQMPAPLVVARTTLPATRSARHGISAATTTRTRAKSTGSSTLPPCRRQVRTPNRSGESGASGSQELVDLFMAFLRSGVRPRSRTGLSRPVPRSAPNSHNRHAMRDQCGSEQLSPRATHPDTSALSVRPGTLLLYHYNPLQGHLPHTTRTIGCVCARRLTSWLEKMCQTPLARQADSCP